MFVMKLKLKWTPASCKWTISFLHLKEQTAELIITYQYLHNYLFKAVTSCQKSMVILKHTDDWIKCQKSFIKRPSYVVVAILRLNLSPWEEDLVIKR